MREDSREVDFTFSTDRIDRYGEIVEQTWRLDSYASNPVVLWSHDSRELPIGKAVNVGVVDGELRGTVVFASERANPRAEQAFQLVREGVLRTGSVGFIPNELRSEMRDGNDVVVLADNELIEFSVTPVPANPDAQARRREKAMAKRKQMQSVPEPVEAEEPKPVEPVAEPEPAIVAEPVVDEPAPVEVVADEPGPMADLTAPVVAVSDDGCASLAMAIAERDATIAALTERAVALEAARAEQQARADKATTELCRRDLSALLGTKIVPAEVDGLVELFRVNRDLYDKQLAAIRARPSMVLLDKQTTIGTAPLPQPTTKTTDSGEALQRRVEAHLSR